ncbi:MAG: B12-binding domain-containing radical SAM protein [Anaerolineae bacterium]
MKVLLIQPEDPSSLVGFTRLARAEPLALEILAATVPDHEVKILDLRVDPSLKETLEGFAPDLVGVTGYTTNVPRMLSICREVKELDSTICTVVGGHHASLCPEDFDCEDVDVIVVGEGEATLPELIEAVAENSDYRRVAGIIYRQDGRQVRTPTRDPIVLDDSPLPARHLVDDYREDYHFQFWTSPYPVETARGCPYRCKFCSVWAFHRGKCRVKSPERVLEELEGRLGDVVAFVDDNFLQSLPRAERIYELIKAAGIRTRFWMQARSDSIVRRPDLIEKWARIGLSTVLVGFEKFREEELADLNKRNSVRTNEEAARIMNRNGVDIWGAFIVDPRWTKPDFDALIDYVRKLKISFPQFTVLTPLPGTELFREKINELTTRNYELFDFLHSVLPTRLSPREFYENMAQLYASTTMSLSELKERVRAGRIQVSALKRVKNLLVDLTNPQTYLSGVKP